VPLLGGFADRIDEFRFVGHGYSLPTVAFSSGPAVWLTTLLSTA
jgi:hypothetical protein